MHWLHVHGLAASAGVTTLFFYVKLTAQLTLLYFCNGITIITTLVVVVIIIIIVIVIIIIINNIHNETTAVMIWLQKTTQLLECP